MKLGIIITRADPEAVYNVLRLAEYALAQGDDVTVFLSGAGVEIDRIDTPHFAVKEKAESLLSAGGKFFACGSCLKIRETEGTALCPLSSLKDEYEILRGSDKVLCV